MELMLELLYEASHDRGAPTHHRYDQIFGDLPGEVQASLLDLAAKRIGRSRLGAVSPAEIFKAWGTNFVDLRYPYDRYKGLSEAQYAQRGDKWMAQGARIETATFAFYPEELVGVLDALRRLTATGDDSAAR